MGKCNKENCKFKHVLQPCRDYDKGFCINGKNCYFSHIPKKLCLNYTYGFCPYGNSYFKKGLYAKTLILKYSMILMLNL